jgi:uncharacterized protein involved in exopolysaccharide biosynthesis
MVPEQQLHPAEQGLSTLEILQAIRRGKWLIAAITLVCTALVGFVGYRIPPTYTAAVLLSPVSASSNGGQMGLLGTVASQLGGLAGLAGGSGDSKKAESVAVLQSEFLTESYIKNNDLLPILFYKRWDGAKGAWKVDSPDKAPTLWLANQYFKKNVRTVGTDSKSGLITLTIRWIDPKVAAKWANDLVALTNDYLRNKEIAESEASITYLDEEAAKTSDVEARQAIYRILESEINKITFAKGNKEFAFKILDPAVPAERASSLPTVAWILIGFFVGLLLSVPAILVKSRWALWMGKTA